MERMGAGSEVEGVTHSFGATVSQNATHASESALPDSPAILEVVPLFAILGREIVAAAPFGW